MSRSYNDGRLVTKEVDEKSKQRYLPEGADVSEANLNLNIDKNEEIERGVYKLFAQSPDWATFFREVLGRSGLVRRHYPSRVEMATFESTETYQMIQQMLTKLRENTPATKADEPEPTRVITVRLPKSLHEALRIEAHEHNTSMNKLCISKLVQYINDQFVPEEI